VRLGARQTQSLLQAELIGVIDHEERRTRKPAVMKALGNLHAIVVSGDACDQHVVGGTRSQERRKRPGQPHRDDLVAGGGEYRLGAARNVTRWIQNDDLQARLLPGAVELELVLLLPPHPGV